MYPLLHMWLHRGTMASIRKRGCATTAAMETNMYDISVYFSFNIILWGLT